MIPTPVVLDANVLASASFSKSVPLQAIMSLWEAEEIEVLVSSHVWQELLITFSKPYWQKRLPKEVLTDALNILESRVTRVDISFVVSGIVKHRQDDLVIATALSGSTEFLVTGDKDLRGGGDYLGVKIRTPQEFLEEFAAFGS